MNASVMSVAYLANQFPSEVEPYVSEEILELRRRGIRVIAGSVREAEATETEAHARMCSPEIVLQPLRMGLLLRAVWICVSRGRRIAPLLIRTLFRGREGPIQRIKALAHTVLGAYYAAVLESRGIQHIHVHHGYFGSWIGMVAAKLLDVSFSMTVHGSDLLLHAKYLDVKIGACNFCLTVSGYNRRYILERYPEIDGEKVLVARLGVEFNHRPHLRLLPADKAFGSGLQLLAVGRLHAVKDHAFLVRACAAMRARGIDVSCSIAGEGPERRNLEELIRELKLKEKVTLLGHVPREKMDSLYDRPNVVVLTSRSEGIPLVLMEAMARRKVVVAPAITGIPELVIDGKTGFLYEVGSQDSFVNQLLFIHSLMVHSLAAASEGRQRVDEELRAHTTIHPIAMQLDWIRHAARVQILHNYNRAKNLESFGDLFIERITPQTESLPREDLVLQQI